MQAGRDVGFFGGLFPKSLQPSRHGSGCRGRAVFALHCQALIGAVCPLRPGRRLLLGQVGERRCKAVGALLRQGVIGHYCPPKLAVSGFRPRNPPSGPCAFVPTDPRPLRSAPALVRRGAGSGAAATRPCSTHHPPGEDDGVQSPQCLSFPACRGINVRCLCFPPLARPLLPSPPN